MTYEKLIDRLMLLINDADALPCLIRHSGREWELDSLDPASEKRNAYIERIKETDDPYAVSFKGSDFTGEDYSFVYDNVLVMRFRAEYINTPVSRDKIEELGALVNCLEDNIGELSSAVKEYISRYDRPLAAVRHMLPMSLIGDEPGWYYNEERAFEAIRFLESRFSEIMSRGEDVTESTEKKESVQEEQDVMAYRVKIQSDAAGQLVILAENPAVADRYLVYNIKYDNPFVKKEYCDIVKFSDFYEACVEQCSRIAGLVNTPEMAQNRKLLKADDIPSLKPKPSLREKLDAAKEKAGAERSDTPNDKKKKEPTL